MAWRGTSHFHVHVHAYAQPCVTSPMGAFDFRVRLTRLGDKVGEVGEASHFGEPREPQRANRSQQTFERVTVTNVVILNMLCSSLSYLMTPCFVLLKV